MKLVPTALHGVFVAETEVRNDERGSFARLFCEDELKSALGGRHVVQINHSRTRQVGTIRGLHFQLPPHAEMKLVRCIEGRVWDVAVDLREDSPTFLRWHAIELASDNARMLVIPEGCAHGFQALAPDSALLYLHTASYAPGFEAGVAWNDPRLAIAWPLPLPKTDGLSERDRRLPVLANDFQGIEA